jgi:Uma2 family endonuclease
MTAEELLKLPRGRFRYELVKGEFITMSPSGSEHGVIVVNITLLLAQYVKAKNLGLVFGAETGFRIEENPDTVRAPDVAFISRKNIPESSVPKEYWRGAPDLAVEDLSPRDAASKVEQKAREWLSAGAKLVWTINPKRRTVTVHRAPSDVLTLSENDELSGEMIVPGFRCRVSEIFI